MAQFTIPESHTAKIKTFLELNEEQKQVVIDLIKEYPIGAGPSALFDSISHQTSLTREQARDILSVIFNFVITLENSKNTKESFIEELKAALDNTDDDDLINNPDAVVELKRLVDIFGDNISYTAYAFNQMSTQSNIYINGTTTIDIRPIIANQTELLGSLLIHQLKITYNNNDESQEIIISLDEKDVHDLMDSLTFSLNNSSILKEKFSETKFITFT